MSYSTDSLPNIIYILADDLGYGDVSCYNEHSKIQTPHLDQLAAGGMKFTDAHSGSAVCTPTRYGVLTGRYAWRSRLEQGVTWSYSRPLIDPNRLTVADVLHSKGYQTACIGKWHLGVDWGMDAVTSAIDFFQPLHQGPLAYGFDYFFGIAASLDIPPYLYIENDRITAARIDTIAASEVPAFWREGPIGNDVNIEEVLPTFTQKAVDYIESAAKKERPFFLYFPLPAPHTPIVPTEAFQGKSHTNAYGDFVLMVDDVVGQIMETLAQTGEADHTLIIFTSDNGFAPYANLEELIQMGHQPSSIYRGHKADIYEGGHRVPFIASWTDKIKAGSTSEETICLTDFMATAANLVGANLSETEAEDSYDLTPILFFESYNAPLREATIHHSVNGSFAIRRGKWKLNFCGGSGGWSFPTPKEVEANDLLRLQLFDLENDPSEQVNLATEKPEIVEQLTTLMQSIVDNGRSTAGTPQKNDRTVSFKK
jgi:arylsulfatase A-like enzyme